MKDDKFHCCVCHQDFTKDRDEEEVWEEAEGLFGEGVREMEVAIVCDGCWNKVIMPKLFGRTQ
jgi:hypothetical protein